MWRHDLHTEKALWKTSLSCTGGRVSKTNKMEDLKNVLGLSSRRRRRKSLTKEVNRQSLLCQGREVTVHRQKRWAGSGPGGRDSHVEHPTLSL